MAGGQYLASLSRHLCLNSIHAGVDAQEEWTCSSLDTSNNLYSLPDLQDFVGRRLSANEISIYSLPSMLNCSGTVSALRFCYYLSNTNQFGTEITVFTLLTLEQNNRTAFTVTNAIPVLSTPVDERCFSFFGENCCDTFPLDTIDQFHLPASNFAFGLFVSDIRLYYSLVRRDQVAYHSLSVSEIGSPSMGDRISVGSIVTDRFVVFRFFISKSN